MSDETTLLPCPFCGGEAEVIEAEYGMYMAGYAVYCRKCCMKLGVTGRLGETYEWSPVFDTEAEAIAAWNTRATVGNGTLTAEQVREAIERHSAWVIGNNRCFHDGAYEEIADELNAMLGRGTCIPHGEWERLSQTQEFRRMYCDCGYELGMDSRDSFPFARTAYAAMPRFCPECGARIVSKWKAVKR